MTRHSIEPAASSERQSGIVMVWFALMLLVLMTMAAFSIDIGNWYYHAAKLQKTADAAALSGAVYLPNDVAGAVAAAKAVAQANSYKDGVGSVVVTAAQMVNQPTQLLVTVTETVPSYFAQMVGLNAETMSRRAVAEYEQPVAMGSPANVFGTESVAGSDTTWSSIPGFVPRLWGSIYGPARSKSSGDAVAVTNCDSSSQDECKGGAGGVNTDYSPDGYFYRVTVDPAAAAAHSGDRLAIEVFDPAAVVVGDHCDQNKLVNAANITNDYVPTTAEAAKRYGWGDTSNTPNGDATGAWCTGDNGTNTTTYVVRQDLQPFAPDSNPPISTGGCAGEQFGSWSPADLGASLDKTNAGAYDKHLAQVFRQWVPICVFDPTAAPASDYLVQVRTSVAPTTSQALMADAATSPLPGDLGGNRFSIRASWVQNAGPGIAWTAPFANNQANKSPGDPYLGGYPVVPRPVLSISSPAQGLSIAGSTRMSLYANAKAGTVPNYYMARVLPGGAGQTLEIRLWDIGDCGGVGCAPTLTFRLPASQGGGTPNCTWLVHDGAPGPGIGAAQTTLFTNKSCTYTVGTSGENPNGAWYTVDIPVPAGYTCTQSNNADCWFSMDYQPNNGGTLADTTTWAARILGNPVRLVQ